jgi:hypothetical protein
MQEGEMYAVCLLGDNILVLVKYNTRRESQMCADNLFTTSPQLNEGFELRTTLSITY